jgi:hypothetical protein
MAACFQSIFDWNGKTHEFDNNTGTQPACKASKNLEKKTTKHQFFLIFND